MKSMYIVRAFLAHGSSGPESGCGFLRRGEPLHGSDDYFNVERFVEKSDRATGEEFVANGGVLHWNSGMFLFHALRYLDELNQFHPKIAISCETAVRKGYRLPIFAR